MSTSPDVPDHRANRITLPRPRCIAGHLLSMANIQRLRLPTIGEEEEEEEVVFIILLHLLTIEGMVIISLVADIGPSRPRLRLPLTLEGEFPLLRSSTVHRRKIQFLTVTAHLCAGMIASITEGEAVRAATRLRHRRIREGAVLPPREE